MDPGGGSFGGGGKKGGGGGGKKGGGGGRKGGSGTNIIRHQTTAPFLLKIKQQQKEAEGAATADDKHRKRTFEDDEEEAADLDFEHAAVVGADGKALSAGEQAEVDRIQAKKLREAEAKRAAEEDAKKPMVFKSKAERGQKEQAGAAGNSSGATAGVTNKRPGVMSIEEARALDAKQAAKGPEKKKPKLSFESEEEDSD